MRGNETCTKELGNLEQIDLTGCGSHSHIENLPTERGGRVHSLECVFLPCLVALDLGTP